MWRSLRREFLPDVLYIERTRGETSGKSFNDIFRDMPVDAHLSVCQIKAQQLVVFVIDETFKQLRIKITAHVCMIFCNAKNASDTLPLTPGSPSGNGLLSQPPTMLLLICSEGYLATGTKDLVGAGTEVYRSFRYTDILNKIAEKLNGYSGRPSNRRITFS